MKHIFIIHSPITYLSSLGVLLKENFDLNDVLFISRGFNIEGPIKINIVDISLKKGFSIRGLNHNLKLFYDRGYHLNNTINNFVKDEKFIAYVSVFNYLERYTVVHPNCVNFNFIEEGVESYHTSHSLSHYATSFRGKFYFRKGFIGLIDRIKESISTFGRTEAITTIPIFSIAYRHDESKKFYCYSEEAYPFVENKIILNFNSIKNKFYPTLDFSNYDNISGHSIWIGNCNIFENNQLYEDFLNTYLLKYIKKEGVNKLLIRFHPKETKEQKKILTDFFEMNKIDITIIPDDIIMEFFLLTTSNCTCLGFNTSLLLYAAYMGHKSISFGDQLKSERSLRYPVYRKYVDFFNENYFCIDIK